MKDPIKSYTNHDAFQTEGRDYEAHGLGKSEMMRLLHATMGLQTEVGALVDEIKRNLAKREVLEDQQTYVQLDLEGLSVVDLSSSKGKDGDGD